MFLFIFYRKDCERHSPRGLPKLHYTLKRVVMLLSHAISPAESINSSYRGLHNNIYGISDNDGWH